MSQNLDIVESQLELGQVKTITSNGGKTIDLIEMLVGETTKAQLYNDTKNNVMDLVVADTDIATLPKLSCGMTKSTLKDLIVSLTGLYNQLNN